MSAFWLSFTPAQETKKMPSVKAISARSLFVKIELKRLFMFLLSKKNMILQLYSKKYVDSLDIIDVNLIEDMRKSR